MKIELNDLNSTYTIEVDNKNGTQCVYIDSFNELKILCLDKEGIKQLIRTLNFLGQEMQ